MATDPAMLIWLDAASDKAADPNENFARELMERFTMGIGTYAEADVRAAAYCFTGWRLDIGTGAFTINQAEHSPVTQKVLGTPVNTGAQVIDLVTHSRASSPGSSRRPSGAIWPTRWARPTRWWPNSAPAYAADLNMTNLLRAVLQHPEFISSTARTGLIKQPTEYVVGALRALAVPAARVASDGSRPPGHAGRHGPGPLRPTAVSAAGPRTPTGCRRRRPGPLVLRPPAGHRGRPVPGGRRRARGRVDALGSLLSVDEWSSTTASALRQAGNDPALLTTMALVSPEYVTN